MGIIKDNLRGKVPVQYIKTWLKREFVLLTLVSTILAFTPFKIIAFGIIIYMVARTVRLPFGMIGRLVLSFLLVTTVVSCIAAIAWITKIGLDTTIILSLLNLGLLAYSFKPIASLPAVRSTWASFLNKDDLMALAAAIIVGIILFLPLSQQPGAGTLGPVIMAGGDNGAHLTMVKTLDLNKGYSIGVHNTYNLRGILMAYPQGWHMNGAFIKWMLDAITPMHTPSRLMAVFYGLSSLWFIMLSFLMVRLALWLRAHIVGLGDRNYGPLWSRALVALGCLVGISAAIISLLAYGFQTQVAALTLLVAEIVLVAYAYKTHDPNIRFKRLLVAMVALVGSNFCWLFLLPVGGLILAGAIIHTLWNAKKLPLWFVGGTVLAAPFLLFQPAVQLFVKTPEYTEGILNQRGAVFETNMDLLILLLISISVFAFAFFKNIRLRIVYFTALIAIIFAAIIMQYQLNTVEELRYFFFKASYTFVVFGTIIAATASGVVAERIAQMFKTKKARFGIAVLLLLFVYFVLLQWQSPSYKDFFTNNLRGVSVQQSHAIADLVTQNPVHAFHITPIGSCNRGDDIRAGQLAYSLAYPIPNDITSFSAFELSFLSKEYLFQSMKEFVEREKFYLVVLSSDQVISNEMQAALGDSMRYITLINLDSTPETEPVTQCPDRIRTLTPEEKARGLL